MCSTSPQSASPGLEGSLLRFPIGLMELSCLCLSAVAAVIIRLLVVGFTSGRIPEIAANRILLKNISVIGVFLGSHLMKTPQIFPQILAVLY